MSASKKPVTAGETYTLEAWIKTDAVTGQADARIAWFSEKNWLAESVSPRVKGTHDWQRVTVTTQAPAGAVAAMVYLGLRRARGPPGSTTWLWLPALDCQPTFGPLIFPARPRAS